MISLCRSKRGSSHVGHVQPVPYGDGGHMHHHVSQQRNPLLPQAGIGLLHSVRSVKVSSSLPTHSLKVKADQFFLKPSSSGILVLLCLVVFHQSVLALLASDHTVPLHHELSWSVSCIGCAGAVLIIGGILFVLLALPYSPWQRCLPQKDTSSS